MSAPARNKARYAAFASMLATYKLDHGCIDCGYDEFPAALHFDHVKGEKLFNLSTAYARPLLQVLEELDKCEVRCANCHAVRTWS